MIFTAAVAAALALLEYFSYFYSNSHFFEGDTLYYFSHRHRTIGDFLLSFPRLDTAGWYRPLTARTVQSLLYPVFGLQPPAYRIVHYILFMIAIFATYKLALAVTRRRLAAGVAAIFFGVHTVNAYITFDVLFTPEIVYTFLYICAATAYLRYRETARQRFFVASIVCFIASLGAKEPALTLPFMLVVLDVLMNRPRIRTALGAARVHFAILAVYLVLIIGYLGVQRQAFQSILKRPGPEVTYRFSLDRTIVHNADYALTWAFNLSRGWQTESRNLHGWTITFLKVFRAIIVLLAICMMFQPERRLIIAGVLWFFITIGPALPLFEHFLPYYLFLPLAGFSIAIGVMADAVYRKISPHNNALAAATIVAPLVVLAGICLAASRNDARDNRFLGWSSRLAFNSMNDLKAAHPVLQPNTTIYISDAGEPDLSWDTSQGAVFNMAYGDDTIHTLFWGWGEVITKGVVERGPVVVMKYGQFHLTDVTQPFLAASEPPVSYHAPMGHELAISPGSAAAGQKYQLSITGLPNTDVTVHYTLDGGPVHAFAAHLDENHQVRFDVSGSTEKGLYKFVGFRPAGTEDWEQAAASVRIN